MPAPSAETSEVWPVWTDLVDNWRAIDVHWMRDRVVNLFDNLAARTSSGIAPLAGSLSFLQDINSLEFYRNDGKWESVRYPNLSVTSAAGPPATVSLRQTAAGTGITLQSDGYAAIEKLNAGLSTLLVDTTGATLKVGAGKAVKFATDAVSGGSLTIDSPVKITGTLSATGALNAPSLTLTGNLTVAGVTASGTVQGATMTSTGQINGGNLLAGGLAWVGNNGGWASFQHVSQPSYGFRAHPAGDTVIAGVTNTIYGTTNHTGPLTVGGGFVLRSDTALAPAGTSAVPLAGIIVVGRGPDGNDAQPNGTIWIQV